MQGAAGGETPPRPFTVTPYVPKGAAGAFAAVEVRDLPFVHRLTIHSGDLDTKVKELRMALSTIQATMSPAARPYRLLSTGGTIEGMHVKAEFAGTQLLVTYVLPGMHADLWHMIKNKLFASVQEIERVALAVLRVVADMRTRGVYHRDIKPGNVLFRRTADDAVQVALADWDTAGVQQWVGQPAAWPLAKLGTPAFAHPEAASRAGAAVPPYLQELPSEADDAWALGVTLLGVFFGDVPKVGSLKSAQQWREHIEARLAAAATEMPVLPDRRAPYTPALATRIRALFDALLTHETTAGAQRIVRPDASAAAMLAAFTSGTEAPRSFVWSDATNPVACVPREAYASFVDLTVALLSYGTGEVRGSLVQDVLGEDYSTYNRARKEDQAKRRELLATESKDERARAIAVAILNNQLEKAVRRVLTLLGTLSLAISLAAVYFVTNARRRWSSANTRDVELLHLIMHMALVQTIPIDEDTFADSPAEAYSILLRANLVRLGVLPPVFDTHAGMPGAPIPVTASRAWLLVHQKVLNRAGEWFNYAVTPVGTLGMLTRALEHAHTQQRQAARGGGGGGGALPPMDMYTPEVMKALTWFFRLWEDGQKGARSDAEVVARFVRVHQAADAVGTTSATYEADVAAAVLPLLEVPVAAATAAPTLASRAVARATLACHYDSPCA